MCEVPAEIKGTGLPWPGVTNGCELLRGCWESSLGPRENKTAPAAVSRLSDGHGHVVFFEFLRVSVLLSTAYVFLHSH